MKEETMTNEKYNPDELPAVAHSLLHQLDGVVLEATMLHSLTELESVYLASVMNIEAFTSNLIAEWIMQGKPAQILVGAAVIEGMLDTSNWMREKAALIQGFNGLI